MEKDKRKEYLENFDKLQFKKEADKKTKVIEKKYYDIKVESMVPATLHYRVLAESPEDALKLYKNSPLTSVKYTLPNRKELKILIYDAGTMLVRLFKNLRG